jgi:hypothetical protein
MNSINLSLFALLTSSLTADAGLYRGSWKLKAVSQQHQTPCRRFCSMSGTNFVPRQIISRNEKTSFDKVVYVWC